MIETLLAQHASVGRAADALRDLCQRESAPDMALLAQARWDFSRALLLHLGNKDRYVYSNLEGSPDPAIARKAVVLREEQEALQNIFRGHVLKWPAEAIAADWVGYRTAVLVVLPILRDRMRRDEQELYPLAIEVERQKALAANSPRRNWAQDVWQIRDVINHDA